VELIALDHGSANEMDAYERVLGDAMAGDPTLFAREDYVEEAWPSSIQCCKPVLRRMSMSPARGGRQSSGESRRWTAGMIPS
jgi:glucose-6-phosphate 1-dehydrogenase